MSRKKKMSKSNQIDSGSESFSEQLLIVRRVFKWAATGCVILGALVYLSTCFSQVKIQETGVLLRFGKIVRNRVEPGICIKYPWPIDKLLRVKTQSIQTLQAGFGADPDVVAEFERTNGPIDQMEYGTLRIPYIITGDKNILHIKVLVMYKISDPVSYLFNNSKAEDTLALLAQNKIMQFVATNNVDNVLTTGKLELRDHLFRVISRESHKFGLGLEVTSVEIRNVRPPGRTTTAFKDVINAQEESREIIHQAEAYQNRLLPEANAEALKIVQEAEAYRKQKIDAASGEAKRFELLAAQYKKEPDVTWERLRLETLEELMPNLTKYVTDTSSGKDLVDLRMFYPGNKK